MKAIVDDGIVMMCHCSQVVLVEVIRLTTCKGFNKSRTNRHEPSIQELINHTFSRSINKT